MPTQSPRRYYTAHVNRHICSGDTNPPSRGAGGPTDPVSPTQRVFLGAAPALGFPRIPLGTETYPAGTTLVGRGEDAKDEVVNRALYELHAAIDSLADRPRVLMSYLVAANNAPGVSALNLSDAATWGALSNKHVVYLGPGGTGASDSSTYMTLLSGARDGQPVCDADLQVVKTNGAVGSTNVSLYPPGGSEMQIFPNSGWSVIVGGAGAAMELNNTGGGGPDTDVTNLVSAPGGPAYCLLNYSLLTRLAQSDWTKMWKAFAHAVVHAAVPGPVTVSRAVCGVGVEDWQDGDVVYRTNFACGPVISLDSTIDVVMNDTILALATFDRVMNGFSGDPVVVPMMLLRRGISDYPTIELEAPTGSTMFGHDVRGAYFRARLETGVGRGKTGFEVIDQKDDATGARHSGWAAYSHLQTMAFAVNTLLDENYSNPFTYVAPNMTVVAPARRFANGGLSEILLAHDLIEVYEDIVGVPGPYVGTWVAYALLGDQTCTVAGVDGDMTGAGIPAVGFFRILRPLWQAGSQINQAGGAVLFGGGFRLVAPPGNTLPALDLLGAAGEAVLRVRQKGTDGVLSSILYIYGDGSMSRAGGVVGNNGWRTAQANGYMFDPVATFYHQVNMQSGVVNDSGTWVYESGSANGDQTWGLPGAGGAADILAFPLNLPDGATITNVTFQYTAMGAILAWAGGRLKVKTRDTGADADWTPGADRDACVVAVTFISFDAFVLAATKFRAFSSGVLAEVVSNRYHEYLVEVAASAHVDAVAQRLHGIRVTYTLPKLTGV